MHDLVALLTRIENRQKDQGKKLNTLLKGQGLILEAIADLGECGQDDAKAVALSALIRTKTAQLADVVDENQPDA